MPTISKPFDSSALLARIATDHRAAVDGFLATQGEAIAQLASQCADALEVGRKLLFFGNGGSACDAMHIAGEFVGRFVHDRRALPALALTADSGILTAVANDYRYEDIFARQIAGLGVAGDVAIGLSTSGSSPNVREALRVAREQGIYTALLTGQKAEGLPPLAHTTLMVPSRITAHVQEAHMVALHALATLIEAKLFPSD